MNIANIKLKNSKIIEGVIVEENSISIALVDQSGQVVSIPIFEIENLTIIRKLNSNEEQTINNMFKISEQHAKSINDVSNMISGMLEKKELLTFDYLEGFLSNEGYKNIFNLTRKGVILTLKNDVLGLVPPCSIKPIAFDKKHTKYIVELFNSPLGENPIKTFYKNLTPILKEIYERQDKVEDNPKQENPNNNPFDNFFRDNKVDFRKAIINTNIPELNCFLNGLIEHLDNSNK